MFKYTVSNYVEEVEVERWLAVAICGNATVSAMEVAVATSCYDDVMDEREVNGVVVGVKRA